MISTLQKWLVEPSGKIVKAEDRRQAKLLSILLLVTLLAVISERIVGGNVPIGFLIFLLLGYVVSRTSYFHLAAVSCIFILGVPSYLVTFTLSQPIALRLMASFMWLVIPILLSSVFLSIRGTAVIIALFIVGIILLPLLNPTLTRSVLWGALGFVATTGIIVLIVMRQRDLIEQDRQAELEAKNSALQREIAAHKQTETALRQSEATSQQFQQKLIALQDVNIELAQIDSFDELCRQVIILGRSRLGFDRLAIWFLDELDPNYMMGSFGTDEEGNLRDERYLRLPTTPKEAFDIKNPADQPTRTWKRKELYNNYHDVVGEGWTVIALLWHGDKIIGFISTDNLLEKRPFSQEQLELLSLYATTVSHLIVRKRAEEKAIQRREMLEKVVALGKQVTQVADLRECLLRIYEIIQKGLEFDRVGLFVVEEANQVARGAFGTDRKGNITEEWGVTIPLNEISSTGRPFRDADSLMFIQDYEAHFGPLSGKNKEDMADVKQFVRIVSWVGEHPVLILNTDNLISQRLITQEQVEALYLFSGYASLAIQNAQLLAQIQEAEKRYRSIFENAAEGIFQVAKEGYFLSANPALANMIGYESPEQLIANITDVKNQLYKDPDRLAQILEQLTGDMRATNFEFEVKRRDDSHAWLSQNVQVVYDENGKLLYYEGTAQDVTDRKQAEEDRELLIRELERRNAELERFTYTVSHDLKSPLITIQGFLGFVERDAISGNIERLRVDISHITEATKRMHQLLEELLELSRVGRLVNPSKNVPFADLADEALELISGRLMQREVQVIVAPNLPKVFVDHHRMVEVLQNLIDNAIKFMGNQPKPRIDIGAETQAQGTVFFVRDNGIGIMPEYHETVFGLFERLDQSVEGTGIGLALAKRIIEVHNGRLWVESAEKGQGSTFLFTLPLANSENETGIS